MEPARQDEGPHDQTDQGGSQDRRSTVQRYTPHTPWTERDKEP